MDHISLRISALVHKNRIYINFTKINLWKLLDLSFSLGSRLYGFFLDLHDFVNIYWILIRVGCVKDWIFKFDIFKLINKKSCYKGKHFLYRDGASLNRTRFPNRLLTFLLVVENFGLLSERGSPLLITITITWGKRTHVSYQKHRLTAEFSILPTDFRFLCSRWKLRSVIV